MIRGAEIKVLARDAQRASELFLSRNIDKTRIVLGVIEELSKIEDAVAAQKSESIFHLASTNINRGR